MKWFLLLGIFTLGGIGMLGSMRFKMYGILSDSEIENAIDKVVESLALGADKNNLKALLRETAKTESNFGKTPDFTLDSGKGVFQLDKIGFDEALKQSSKVKDLVLKMGYNLNKLDYSQKQITQDVLLNTILARLYYYKKPGAIPTNREERAAYWKKYYNSILGAGSVEAYLSRSEDLYA